MSKWGHAMRAAGFGAAAYACAGATAGIAADMPFYEPEPTPQTKVEFGTGWYIRGDAGGAFEKGLLPHSLTGEPDQTKINWSADLGGGYKFNNWFRGDATLGMLGQQNHVGPLASVNCYSAIRNVFDPLNPAVSTGVYAVPGQCTPIEQTNLQKYLVLVNAYIDLGTWYGVTPYVGAGVGAAIIHESGALNYYNASDGSPYRANLVLPNGSNPTFLQGPALTTPLNPQPVINYGTQNWDKSVKLTKYNFAWALMAGFGYNLTDNAIIDIGYRYVNMGRFTDITGFSQSLSSQEIRLGIRYLVD